MMTDCVTPGHVYRECTGCQVLLCIMPLRSVMHQDFKRDSACMQVKHNAEELNEGETVILTLADRNILDDKGDLDDEADELENALVVCHFLCKCISAGQ